MRAKVQAVFTFLFVIAGACAPMAPSLPSPAPITLRSGPEAPAPAADIVDATALSVPIVVDTSSTVDLGRSFSEAERRWIQIAESAESRRKWYRFWGGLVRYSSRLGGAGGGATAAVAAEDNPGTARIAGGIAAAAVLLNWLLNGEEFAVIAEQCQDVVLMKAEIAQFFSRWGPQIQGAEITPELRARAATALEEFGNERMMPAYRRCMDEN